MLYIIDAAFLLNGGDFTEGNQFFTVPQVMDEFKDISSRTVSLSALKKGILFLIEPEQSFILKVNESRFAGKLSFADKMLAALALQFKNEKKEFSVFTDDFSLQNFFSINKIKFEPVLRGSIKKTAVFQKKCSSCGKKFSSKSELKKCDVCGSEIQLKTKFK
ncbi:MAG: hypothetical protein JW703_01090 [Candidatus Diapherotrites archaeon]|nr:hypothetical protein [Candidatus Diapherotrites archaeon]